MNQNRESKPYPSILQLSRFWHVCTVIVSFGTVAPFNYLMKFGPPPPFATLTLPPRDRMTDTCHSGDCNCLALTGFCVFGQPIN